MQHVACGRKSLETLVVHCADGKHRCLLTICASALMEPCMCCLHDLYFTGICIMHAILTPVYFLSQSILNVLYCLCCHSRVTAHALLSELCNGICFKTVVLLIQSFARTSFCSYKLLLIQACSHTSYCSFKLCNCRVQSSSKP